MKTLCTISIVIYLLSACAKKQHPVTEPEEPVTPAPIHIPIIELGKGSVLKDGQPWDLTFECWYYKSDTAFQVRANQYVGTVEAYFSTIDIPLKKGVYPVEYRRGLSTMFNNVPESFVAYTVDGDQGADTYVIDTTRHDHFLEVLRVDTTLSTVEGRFQIFFRKEPIVHGLGLPHTMALTEGKFHLVVKRP